MSDIIIDNPTIYNSIFYFMHYFGLLTKMIAILFIIGVYTNKPKSFLFVNFIVKTLLAIYLIYRFNSYRKDKITFTELDRKICYSAGMYIIVFSFVDVIQVYVNELRNIIDPYTVPVIKYIQSLIL
jgi:hypothetical protein